jgi:Cu/Ag efflux protein CusF
MKLNRSSLLALGLVIGVSGCSSVSQPNQGEPLLTKAAVVSAQATIVGINYDTREVTLEIPNKPGDNFVDVVVSDDVQNLSQIRFGDQVTVEYIEAVSVTLFRAGEVEPGVDVTVAAANAVPGARPARAAGIEKSITVVVEGVDRSNELVGLRMPDGARKVVKVSNPAILERVSTGDKVRISFVRALATRITPNPVR